MAMRVLLVEDNPHNTRLIEQLLDDISEEIGKGIILSKADSGESALREAKTKEFSLVLMDISLPDMDGITITREIKTMNSYEQVPFIVVTAHVMPGDIETFKAIFDDFIAKPIDEEVFITKVKRWIGEGNE